MGDGIILVWSGPGMGIELNVCFHLVPKRYRIHIVEILKSSTVQCTIYFGKGIVGQVERYGDCGEGTRLRS